MKDEQRAENAPNRKPDATVTRTNGERININRLVSRWWYLANGLATSPGIYMKIPAAQVKSLADDAVSSIIGFRAVLESDETAVRDAAIKGFIAGMCGQEVSSIEQFAIKHGREKSKKVRTERSADRIREFIERYGEAILKSRKASGAGWKHIIEEQLQKVPNNKRPGWRAVYEVLKERERK